MHIQLKEALDILDYQETNLFSGEQLNLTTMK